MTTFQGAATLMDLPTLTCFRICILHQYLHLLACIFLSCLFVPLSWLKLFFCWFFFGGGGLVGGNGLPNDPGSYHLDFLREVFLCVSWTSSIIWCRSELSVHYLASIRIHIQIYTLDSILRRVSRMEKGRQGVFRCNSLTQGMADFVRLWVYVSSMLTIGKHLFTKTFLFRAYRAFYILNWIYRYFTEPRFTRWIGNLRTFSPRKALQQTASVISNKKLLIVFFQLAPLGLFRLLCTQISFTITSSGKQLARLLLVYIDT